MHKIKLFLLPLFVFLLFFCSFESEVFAANQIRVTGFGYPRVSYSFSDVTTLTNALTNPSNFGESGVVPCAVTILPPVNTIQVGSLVNGGVRKADVFIGGQLEMENDLTSEEAQELANFINAGGIVYITDNAYSDSPPTNNKLFEKLGLSDHFSSEIDSTNFIGESSDPISTPITNGPFGKVGPLTHGEFRIFNNVSFVPVAKGFETLGGGIITFALPSQTLGFSENFVLHEKAIGSGYLSVSGSPIHLIEDDEDNINYFKNLVALACKEEAGILLDVPLFKQTDSQWGYQEYDSGNKQSLDCGKTIAQCGCATTSAAMILKYYGVDKDPYGNPTTPESVNNYFKRNEVCSGIKCSSLGYAYGGVKWGAVGKYSQDANKAFGSQKIIYSGPGDYNYDLAVGEINGGRPLVLRVPGRQHWVVAKGSLRNTLAINDPAYNRNTLDDPAYGNTAVAMRKYEKTASDFSSFEVTSLAPTQLLVTDKEGRRTGFDSSTSSVLQEIPNSFYYFEEAYADATEENPAPSPDKGIYTALILTPEQDNYKVEVIAPKDELYSFSVHASDKDANINLGIFENTEEGSEEHEYVFGYSPEPSSETKFFQEISIDVKPFSKRNLIFRKFFLPVPVSVLSSSIFDARKIDKTTIKFGKTGNEESLVWCSSFYFDVNRDGLRDLTCLFDPRKMGFEREDTLGILTGKTVDGVATEGRDSVIVY